MAGENRSMIGQFHSLLVLPWLVFSTIMYGMLSVLLCPLHYAFTDRLSYLWNANLLFVAGVRVIVRGAEKLHPDKRYVLIANHQSHIDIPILIRGLRQHLTFIAKKELFSIPVFGWAMRALGHVYIDRSKPRMAHASILKAVEHLRRRNVSLVLFPEGTRSPDGKVGQFKQGSFQLALLAGVEVVPVAIHDSRELLHKHSLLIKSGSVHLTIGDPITVDETMNKATISERVRGVIEGMIQAGTPSSIS